MKNLTLLVCMLSLFQQRSFSQNQHLIDSLETALKNHNASKLEMGKNTTALYDTTAINILAALSQSYWGNNPVKAMNYAEQTLALSDQIGYKKGKAKALNSLGVINHIKGDYINAFAFFKKELLINQEAVNKKGMASSYNNIGNTYMYQGNYPEALKNFLTALKIIVEVGDKERIAGTYANIGIIYKHQANYPEALKNFFTALKIFQEIGNQKGIAIGYNNIGVIYYDQGNYPEALKNYMASLKIREAIGDKHGNVVSNNNIGGVYYKQGNYSQALNYHFSALKLAEEIGANKDIATSFEDIGNAYVKQNKYDDAAQYLNRSLALSKEIGNLEGIKSAYKNLSALDSAQQNFKQSLEHYKLYIIYRDSLLNNENTKKITQQQMQYDFDKKETLTKAVQEKKDVIAQKELQKQKLVRNGFVGGFAVVLLFAGVFFRQRKKISREMHRSDEERKRSDELLLNILPSEVAYELKETGHAKAKSFTMVTVMFTDFKDFTNVSEKISAELLVDEIHHCFSAFDTILQKYKIEKIKTIGDAYLCASGLPVSNYTHATDMINAAFEIRTFMLQRRKEKEAKNEIPFELRIGIHTGPVVAGIVGVKKYAYDIWGDTVNIAARIEQNSEAGKINISGTTYELVKDKFNCIHRGKIEAKNKGMIDMYFVEKFNN